MTTRPAEAKECTIMAMHATLQDRTSGPSIAKSCIFCQMDDPEVNTVLMQSDNFYVRMDNFPATLGHVEVVPKRHVESFFGLSPAEASEAYLLMSEAQEKLQQQYEFDGFTIGINDGRAAGRTIDHLHIHLIPRRFGDVADPTGGIRQVLPNSDCSQWVTSD